MLTPSVSYLKRCMKDDWDFIRNVAYLCVLPSYDALSFYSSIPHDLGLEFDICMFLTLVTIIMGMKFVPLYACYSVGYLGKNYFISNIVTVTVHCIKYVNTGFHSLTGILPYIRRFCPYSGEQMSYSMQRLVEKVFTRFMDDDFALWPKKMLILMCSEKFLINYIPIEIYRRNLWKSSYEQHSDAYVLNFLDLCIILHQGGRW